MEVSVSEGWIYAIGASSTHLRGNDELKRRE